MRTSDGVEEDKMADAERELTRRQVLERAAAAGAVLTLPGVLAACGGDEEEPTEPGAGATEPSGEPLKIGYLTPTSGVFAVIGKPLLEGFELYLDENGGALGGRPVELIAEDEGDTPEVGVRKAQKLLRQDRVEIVTGVLSSATALAIRDIFHEEKVPLITSNAGANAITGEAKSPYIFRSSASNFQYGSSMAQWLFDNVTKDGVVLAASAYAAGEEITGGFRQVYEEAGGKVAGAVFPPLGTTEDYQPFFSQIRDLGAKAVFAFFPGGDGLKFVTQYGQFGLKDSIPLLGSGFLTDEVILEAQGNAALGVRTSLHYAPRLDNPLNEKFFAAYEEKFGSVPISQSMQAYIAGQLIDRGLTEVGGDLSDVDAFAEAMANVGELESPGGVFSMDPETHNPTLSFYLREVQEIEGQLWNEPIEELGEFSGAG
jgi:branched-chain amino acid transport system substrate-binding protein